MSDSTENPNTRTRTTCPKCGAPEYPRIAHRESVWVCGSNDDFKRSLGCDYSATLFREIRRLTSRVIMSKTYHVAVTSEIERMMKNLKETKGDSDE